MDDKSIHGLGGLMTRSKAKRAKLALERLMGRTLESGQGANTNARPIYSIVQEWAKLDPHALGLSPNRPSQKIPQAKPKSGQASGNLGQKSKSSQPSSFLGQKPSQSGTPVFSVRRQVRPAFRFSCSKAKSVRHPGFLGQDPNQPSIQVFSVMGKSLGQDQELKAQVIKSWRESQIIGGNLKFKF
ncbi:hypothetical protein Lal_00015418 [Lupinus albus]|nr:hypothetical protein Lal_00015418 [Lupinus albus]